MSKPNKPMLRDMLLAKQLARGAHYIDLTIRYDGKDLHFEADWLDEVLNAYFEREQGKPHEHEFNVDLGDPCFCGSDNCAACMCGVENHD